MLGEIAVTDLGERADALRLLVLETHRRAGLGHLGSALSIVEIVTVLRERCLVPAADGDPDGDRLILSKGHAALALYCRLALEGRIGPEQLAGFGRDGAELEPHPNEVLVPAVGASSGSLGQGMSIALGLALGSRLKGRADRVAAIVGDGETNEGQIWEAAQSAGHLRLDNLLVVVDRNGMQQDGPMAEILPMGDIATAWRTMGWASAECDGHDTRALEAALAALLARDDGRPKLLVAATVKGRGVPFLEGRTESHYPPPLSPEEIVMVRHAARAGAPR